MSLFVNAAPFEENNSIVENKKKQRNHTLKKPQKVKLPTISFNDDDSASLADFKPLAPPKMMKEPHMGKDMEQDTNMNNNFIHEGFDNDESFVSEYPQKYSEKPMSRLEQHRQFVSTLKKNKLLTVVKPGTQSRRFTHINDTVEACYMAWCKNKCRHYSISNRKSHTIIQVAKMFNTKIKLLPPRAGERYASALTSMNLSNKVYKLFGRIQLKDYIKNIVKTK